MASVDEKVVRMTFDNAKFEAGVQKTLETLAKLKASLNLDKAGSDFEKLQQASNKVNFSHMSDALDQVSNRFSTFGIIGMTVLQNLTTSAMNSAKTILNSMTSSLIQGGKRRALNIEQAKFQINGLGYAWEDVAEDINYGVKSTAYGLDSAAKAASQLLASNVKVGDSMKAALRGISGVAAMTSSEYDDIARVFTTVAGNGRLMGDQLNQLSARGLNVAATLGKALGKTEGEIREMVSHGEIDFATFSKAMDDAFGEHAKKANDTFTGSLSNMKAALSRIGAEFATPAYTNLRHAMNALTPVIDDVKKALGPLYETSAKAMEFASKLAVEILGNANLGKKLTGSITSINKIFHTFAQILLTLPTAMAPVSRAFGNFINLFRSMKSHFNLDTFLESQLDGVTRIVTAFGQTVAHVIDTAYLLVLPIVKAFQESFGEVFGHDIFEVFVGASEAVERFASKLTVSVRVYDNIKKTFSGIFTVVGAIADIMIKLVNIISAPLASVAIHVFGFMLDVTLKITSVIGDLIVGVKDFINELKSLDSVQLVVSKIKRLLEKLGISFEDTFESTHGFINLLLDGSFDAFALVLSKIAEAFLYVAHGVDYVIMKTVELIRKLRELPQVQKAIQKVTNAFDTLRTKVSDVASKLSGKFFTAFDRSRDVLSRVISKVRELIDKYIELPTLEEVVTKFQEFILEVFENGLETFDKVVEVLGNVIDRIKELGGESFKNVLQNIADLRQSITETIDLAGKLEWVKNLFFGIRDGIVDMSNTTGGILDKVKDKLSTFIDWLGTKFSTISLGDIIAAGAGGSAIATLLSLSKFLSASADLTKSVQKFMDTFTGIPNAIGKTLKELGGVLESQKNAIKMDAVANIIKAIVMLAGAIAVLATMDQEKVRSSAIVIGILGGALVLIAGLMTKLSGVTTEAEVAKTAGLMASIGGAMVLLVVALKVLSTIDMNGIGKRLVAMGVLMAELSTFAIAVNRLAPQMSGGSVAIVAISFSMIMMAKAFQNLSEVPLESVAAGTILMGAMVSLLAAINIVGGKAKKTAASAGAIIAVAVSLHIIIEALKKLGEMDQDVAKQGLAEIGVLMGLISMTMLSTAVSGQYAVRSGGAMILISAALHVIVEAIEKIAALPPSSVERAEGVVGKILILFGVLTAISKFAGEFSAKAGAAIALMSGSMIMLAAGMAILAKIDPEGLDRAVDAVTRMMVMFALLLAATSVVRSAETVIVKMTICIAALGGVLAILSLLEPENLTAASEAVSRLIGMFALLLVATGYAGKVRASMFVMLGVVTTLAGLLLLLCELPTEDALKASLSLSALLVSFSASLLITQFIGPEALVGVGVLIAAISMIGAFIAALALLASQFEDGKVEEFLNKGLPILQAIGEGIGSFVGSIVDGLLSSASASLPTIGENLSSFMVNLKSFIDGSKAVDESAQNGINTIVGMIMAVAAADFIDALTWWSSSGSSIQGLSNNLPALGDAVTAFAESMKGIAGNEATLEAGCNAISTLVKSLPMDIGVGLNILAYAGVDYDALADGLPKLGHAIFMFAQNIAGMDTGSVENTERACNIVMRLVNNLPQTYGGLAGMIAGGTFIDDFADSLPKLGHAMFMYAQNIAGMDTGSVANTDKACLTILRLSKALPQTYGGLAGMIAGGTFIDDFADQLPKLAHGFFMYAQNIAGMDTGSVANTEAACKVILGLADALPKTYGGLAGMITGGTFIDDFSESLMKLGHAFFMYAQNIGGMDTGSVYNTDSAIRMIIDLCNYVSDSTGFLSISRDVSMVDMANNLAPLGHAFFMYAQNIGGMDTGSVANTDKACRTIIDLCNYMADSTGFLSISRDVSMVDMANNLPPVAHAFFMYAQNIGGMDTGSVENTRSACYTIIAFLDQLPNSAGIAYLSKSNVGESLARNLPLIGEAFLQYAAKIASIDMNKMNESSGVFQGIMEFVANLATVDMAPAEAFSKSLTDLADSIQNGFVEPLKKIPNDVNQAGYDIPVKLSEGFERGMNFAKSSFSNAGKGITDNVLSGIRNGSTEANSAVIYVSDVILGSFTNLSGKFTTAGTDVAKAVSNGISNSTLTITGAMNKILTTAVNSANSKLANFVAIGAKIVTNIGSGIQNSSFYLSNVVKSVITSAINSVSTQRFYDLGKYAMQGLANGMKENDYIVKEASKKAAENALKAANDALKVASPSREFYKTGRWTMIGLANGISENAKYAESRSEKAASDILETTNKILSDLDMTADLNYDPVIRPVIDMTNVKQGIGYINNAFGEKSFSLGAINGIGNIDTGIDRFQYDQLMHKLDKLIEIEQSNDTPRSIEFNQFNNSPKALNTAEIYRQTKSQFSKLKDMVSK